MEDGSAFNTWARTHLEKKANKPMVDCIFISHNGKRRRRRAEMGSHSAWNLCVQPYFFWGGCKNCEIAKKRLAFSSFSPQVSALLLEFLRRFCGELNNKVRIFADVSVFASQRRKENNRPKPWWEWKGKPTPLLLLLLLLVLGKIIGHNTHALSEERRRKVGRRNVCHERKRVEKGFSFFLSFSNLRFRLRRNRRKTFHNSWHYLRWWHRRVANPFLEMFLCPIEGFITPLSFWLTVCFYGRTLRPSN